MRRSLLVLSIAAGLLVAGTTSSFATTRSVAAEASTEVAHDLPPSVAAALPPAAALAVTAAKDVRAEAIAPVIAVVTREPRVPAETRVLRSAPPVATLISGARDACVMSVPVSGDPASFLATARRALGAKGGTVAGTTTSGTFSVPAPLGKVEGSYALDGAAARITIAPSSLGFVQSCSRVYGVLTSSLR